MCRFSECIFILVGLHFVYYETAMVAWWSRCFLLLDRLPYSSVSRCDMRPLPRRTGQPLRTAFLQCCNRYKPQQYVHVPICTMPLLAMGGLRMPGRASASFRFSENCSCLLCLSSMHRHLLQNRANLYQPSCRANKNCTCFWQKLLLSVWIVERQAPYQRREENSGQINNTSLSYLARC